MPVSANGSTARRGLPISADEPLGERLAERTREADLVERATDTAVRCIACAHRCVVEERRAGACGVRFVRNGALRVPYGYVARRYVRAIETNTVFHVRPGARALTFGMYGCDLRCPYCHNWKISQALRESGSDESPVDIAADALVGEALGAGCEVVCAAYNEPMISAEWTRAVFTEARRHGLVTCIISDGNTTPEALAYMRPVTDVFRIDLKAETSEQYRVLGGRPGPVFAAIGEARRLGYWVEVVTLVVPGFNDDPSGLRRIGDEIAAVDPAIPWHLNAFHPRYRLEHLPRTQGYALIAAAGAAYARGLRFVYVSNCPDEVRELSHTRCPACHEVVVERFDYRTRAIALRAGACPSCGEAVPGLWGDADRTVPPACEPSSGEMP